MSGIRRVGLTVVLVAAFAGACLPGTALAGETRATDLVSTGPAGGNGVPAASYKGSSDDGTRVFFQTAESLVSTDTDSSMDIYERANSITTLISTGPSGGNATLNSTFNGASGDGSKVFFRTAEPLVGTDTDSNADIYMRSGGTTTLISTGPAGGNGAFSAVFDAISADGSRVFFDTSESLVSSDTDVDFDIYQRSGTTTTLISTGPAGGNGESDATFDGISRDGTRVFFETDESLVSGDTDITFDIYQRSGSTTTHLSIGPAGGNGDEQFDYDAFYDRTSADGTKVWLHTDEILTADDGDDSADVYQVSGGTISRISFGPAGGDAELPAFFVGSSDDGSRVFFDTQESLASADTDSSVDLYERSGGTATLLSIGPDGGNGTAAAGFQGASADGTRVLFQTTESLVSADTDTQQDIYVRAGGQTTLISTGSAGGNGAFPVVYKGGSSDGLRVYFTTAESLEPVDTDGIQDIYQRYAGDTTWISTGPLGGNGPFFPTYDDVSRDGTRVFFETAEVLNDPDADSSQDVYSSSTTTAYARPRGATPFRVALVPAFQVCGAGNSNHGAPLSYPSCNPPTQASGFLTVGSPDANSRQANSSGFVKFITVQGNGSTPADEADMKIIVSLTDVRKKSDLSDYTGQLQLLQSMRMTDRSNGSAPVDPGTVSDFNFATTVPCTATADANIGSTCSVSTTADAVMPGAILEIKRTVIELAQVKLFDGGSDGVASTAGNTLFMVQGLLAP